MYAYFVIWHNTKWNIFSDFAKIFLTYSRIYDTHNELNIGWKTFLFSTIHEDFKGIVYSKKIDWGIIICSFLQDHIWRIDNAICSIYEQWSLPHNPGQNSKRCSYYMWALSTVQFYCTCMQRWAQSVTIRQVISQSKISGYRSCRLIVVKSMFVK